MRSRAGCGRPGPGVDRVSAGDLVVVNPLRTCGVCRRCRAGAVNQCEDGAVRGYRLPGAAVTRLLVPASELHRVPPGIPPEHACLAEPLAAAWHAATRADELSDVVVIGAGSIGQLVLAALRQRGAARITVVEPDQGKRDLARACGADEAIGPGQRPAGPRFTAVFDCVSRPETLEWAVQETMAGGAIVTVGVSAGAVTLPVPRMQRYEIAQLGSGLYTPGDLGVAVDLIASGKVRPGYPVVTRSPGQESTMTNPPSGPRAGSPMRVIAAASFAGALMEWYDFFLYGTASALVFNKLFFPHLSPVAGTAASFATFGVGFVARPLGGVVFGHFGDRLGRKSMLIATVLIIGCGTFLIGLLPTYSAIGVWAPVLLVVLRLLQGIGLGGEYAGAALLTIEHAPERRRGLPALRCAR